ncbi:MAG: hypothetical protein AABO58_00125 [Acidobacteriota bacterium]
MHSRRFIPILSLLFVAAGARAEVEITLKNSFIAKFKERATINAKFIFDKAHARPNTPKKDGDLHAAGRAPEIGLATVAEIMNAKDEVAGVGAIHDVEGTNASRDVTGAWRIWAEHGGGEPHVQGKPLPKFNSTNPDHVFQIHPLTRIGDIDMGDSLRATDGFTYKDAEDAFTRYENVRCKITPGVTTTKLTTSMAGFNYVEFIMEVLEDPIALPDGKKVFASVLDLDGNMLIRKRRMMFISDTPPERAVRNLHAGDQLHVVGIPRINLALVAWRVANAKVRPEVLTWNLPYEIIVVAAFAE